MTELEGAILGLLRDGRDTTPYAVRRQFQISPSAEWSGSAGAVYPAIRRLEAAGLIVGRAQKDGRGTKRYALTETGRAAHDGWLCDVKRASGPGMDPFRTRAGQWFFLSPRRRHALMKALAEATASRLTELERHTKAQDESDRIMQQLHVLQLRSRLVWLKGQQ
jgi:DNA-binding PadR family transcriptional regulator